VLNTNKSRSQTSNGLFIVFDGPADSGKTCILRAISTWLESQQILTHTVVEPAPGAIGTICREYANKPEHPYTLACLIAAGRYRNLVDEVIPYQSRGYVVLGHRYLASNYVYQILHGVEKEFIDSINAHIIIPDMTFIVTSTPDKIKQRRWLHKPPDLFQANEYIEREIHLFEEAANILHAKGHPLGIINNNSELAIAIKEVQQNLSSLLNQKLGLVVEI